MNLKQQSSYHFLYIKNTFSTLFKNWIINIAVKFTLLAVVVGGGAIAFFWHSLPPLVPLWYAQPWGAERLAHPAYLTLLPVGSLIILFLSIMISIYLAAEDLIFTQILFITSLVVSLLSLILLIKIIFLVT